MLVTQHFVLRNEIALSHLSDSKSLDCQHIKNEMLSEGPHHNRVADIFDTSNLLKSFWNVFPCKDVRFSSVKRYTFSLIYNALRIRHLFFLFFGLSLPKTSCWEFHTIHGHKRSLVITNCSSQTTYHIKRASLS